MTPVHLQQYSKPPLFPHSWPYFGQDSVFWCSSHYPQSASPQVLAHTPMGPAAPILACFMASRDGHMASVLVPPPPRAAPLLTASTASMCDPKRLGGCPHSTLRLSGGGLRACLHKCLDLYRGSWLGGLPTRSHQCPRPLNEPMSFPPFRQFCSTCLKTALIQVDPSVVVADGLNSSRVQIILSSAMVCPWLSNPSTFLYLCFSGTAWYGGMSV